MLCLHKMLLTQDCSFFDLFIVIFFLVPLDFKTATKVSLALLDSSLSVVSHNDVARIMDYNLVFLNTLKIFILSNFYDNFSGNIV